MTIPTTFATRHAKRRYLERCAGGPGLLIEFRGARRPTKRQWRVLMRMRKHWNGCVADSCGRIWIQRVLISKLGTVIVTKVSEAGDVRIVTCYPLHSRHSRQEARAA